MKFDNFDKVVDVVLAHVPSAKKSASEESTSVKNVKTLDTNKATSKILKAKPSQAKPSQASAPLIFSFFAGAGFLDLGFEKEGFEVAYVNEIHAPFLEAYKHSRSKLKIPQPLYGYHSSDETELLSNKSDVLSKLLKSALKT